MSKLIVTENKTSKDGDYWIDAILGHMEPWNRYSPKRKDVAIALQEIFKGDIVYVGGHHVAVILKGTDGGDGFPFRFLMVEGTGVDW